MRLFLLFVALAIPQTKIEASTSEFSLETVLRMRRPGLAPRLQMFDQGVLVYGHGRFLTVPADAHGLGALEDQTHFGDHYWGGAFAFRPENQQVAACVDGGRRLISFQLNQSKQAPTLRSYSFGNLDSCGGVGAANGNHQGFWVSGRQSRTLLRFDIDQRDRLKLAEKKPNFLNSWSLQQFGQMVVGTSWGFGAWERFPIKFDLRQDSLDLKTSYSQNNNGKSFAASFSVDRVHGRFALLDGVASQLHLIPILPVQPSRTVLHALRLKYPIEIRSWGQCLIVLGSLEIDTNSLQDAWEILQVNSPSTVESLDLRTLEYQPSDEPDLFAIRFFEIDEKGHLWTSSGKGIFRSKEPWVPQRCHSN